MNEMDCQYFPELRKRKVTPERHQVEPLALLRLVIICLVL